VKLENFGTQSVDIHSIAITSPLYSTDFSQTNNCGTSIAPKNTCTIEVTFSPNTLPFSQQLLTATLTVNSTAPGPQSTDLSGAATALSFSPSTLNFGMVAVGQTSAPMPVTLTNLSAITQALQGAWFFGANPSDFAQTNNCPQSLASKSSCTVNVTFTPGAAGSRSAEVTALSPSTFSASPVSLSGTGQ